MKKILVCAQKGGVGKSLIADELAFSFERTHTPLAFYDLDKQGGTLHTTQKRDDAEVAIIDTPGALQAELRDLIKAADLVIIPARASAREVPPFQRMINSVESNLKKGGECLYVINFFNRFSLSRDFLLWLKDRREKGETPFTRKGSTQDIFLLPQAEAFAQAPAALESVVTFAPGGAAAKATLALCNAVRERLGFEKEAFDG